MIILDLSCSEGHRFEGWFRSSGDFGVQQEQGLLSCPHCGSVAVRRLPSAVHVASSPAPVEMRRPAASAATSREAAHPLAMLKAAVELIVRSSEDVGSRFAEEARKIHYHEAPARPIRGQATDDDCSALREEGIEFLSLPPVTPEDLN